MVCEIEDEYVDKLIEKLYENESDRPELVGMDYEAFETMIRLTILKMEQDGKIRIRY